MLTDWLARGKPTADHWYCKNSGQPESHKYKPANGIAPPDENTASDEVKARRAAEQKHHELCQQWRAAEAAEEAAHVAWWQLWISFAGLAGLIGTLYFASESARYASEAAAASSLNAQAIMGAERAQILETIVRQNVDYNVMGALQTGLPLDDDHKFTFEVVFALKNYGRTFGILRGLSYQMQCMADLPAEPVYAHKALGNVETLEAGDESDNYYCWIDRSVTLREARLISEGRLTVWFYGRVFYSHIFGGRDVEHRFLYRYRGNGFERVYRQNYSSHYNAEAA